MPELPDIEVYLRALRKRVQGHVLERVRLASPFLLRTFDPPITSVEGLRLEALERLGKRLVFVLENDLFLVMHLMIAGRLQWPEEKGAKIPGKLGQAALDFDSGTLLLTEAGSKRRASLHVVRGRDAVRAMDRGGLEPLTATPAQFAEVLRRERHTLKRTLTDPRLFSGIGNAYSDELLHRAKMSPMQLSTSLDDTQCEALRRATVSVLTEWTEKLDAELEGAWPKKVTAFRDDMAVHGRYRKPCPVCGTLVQRIAYADNETNYCARCQTDGRLLADRSLSRLLKDDWPKTLEEMEEGRFPGMLPKAEPPVKVAAVKKKSSKASKPG